MVLAEQQYAKSVSDGDMAAQDLTKLKVDELTPLTPEVISRQATINIGECRT